VHLLHQALITPHDVAHVFGGASNIISLSSRATHQDNNSSDY